LIKMLNATADDDVTGLEFRIKKLDETFQSESDPSAALPALMQLRKWCEDVALISKQSPNMSHSIRLWQVTQDIFRRFGNNLSIQNVKVLQKSLLLMGYEKAAKLLVQEYIRINKQSGLEIEEKEVLLDSSKIETQISTPSSYSRFQLEFGGHLMIRSVNSMYDSRVKKFYPDKWQKNLLDVVDARGSVLVVAPTSSGKTFISWYTMKRTLEENRSILRTKDRRRIIYVCPTKSLVQQAAAEIYAKYGDVFGIYTEDYNRKILESEVTIVLPKTFESILTSHQREDFIKSIDYVIFDEVHCIGNGNEGDVWSRLIMLNRSPFIALSATIGEPEIFQFWLTRVGKTFSLKFAEKPFNEKVFLIHHHLRWSDLQNYMYCPNQSRLEKNNPFEIGELFVKYHRNNPSWKSNCINIHPGAAISMGLHLVHLKNFPANLYFSSNDSLKLFESMNREVERSSELMKFKKSLLKNSPEHFFNNLLITKNDTRNWEEELKKILWEWMYDGYLKNANRVLNFLARNLKKRIFTTEEINKINNVDPYSTAFVLKHITQILIDLEQEDRLPVLVFCLDRIQCECLCKRVIKDFVTVEKFIREKEKNSDVEKRKEKKKGC